MENKKITSNFIEKENSNYQWKDKVKIRELTEIPQENKVMAEDLNYLNKKPDIVKQEISGEIRNVNERVSNLVNNDFKKIVDELNDAKKQIRDLREIVNNLKPNEYAKDIIWHLHNDYNAINFNYDANDRSYNKLKIDKKYKKIYFKFFNSPINEKPINGEIHVIDLTTNYHYESSSMISWFKYRESDNKIFLHYQNINLCNVYDIADKNFYYLYPYFSHNIIKIDIKNGVIEKEYNKYDFRIHYILI